MAMCAVSIAKRGGLQHDTDVGFTCGGNGTKMQSRFSLTIFAASIALRAGQQHDTYMFSDSHHACHC